MAEQIFICGEQSRVDKYLEKNDIYNNNESAGINLLALSHYIVKNNLFKDDVTEALLEKFKV